VWVSKRSWPASEWIPLEGHKQGRYRNNGDKFLKYGFHGAGGLRVLKIDASKVILLKLHIGFELFHAVGVASVFFGSGSEFFQYFYRSPFDSKINFH